MAYVHCNRCGWEQDDFWSEDYNPVRALLDWEHDLIHNEQLDEPFTDCRNFIEYHGRITKRELIARRCEQAASRIRGMMYPNAEDAARAGNACPRCQNPLTAD